jgi:hypothetical protein
MFNTYTTDLSIIRNSVHSDVTQLLTIEGDWEEQVEGITIIGKELLKKFPSIKLHISRNAHDYGSYAGLEVEDECLEEFPDIENDALVIAEQLGYDV